MLKVIFKLLAVLGVVFGALMALAYWEKSNAPEYIEIYSDTDNELF